MNNQEVLWQSIAPIRGQTQQLIDAKNSPKSFNLK